ncbi:carbohydrate ABC transporter permease [Breznakiella homolactica]|uniref:Sugar ABC transporter permease n=1 Tax=Breznakiella homolactica TaxID=2798577 RepID=A0A7T7XN44_9SPIR|nr:sugar ABC transporter permease [Breznakiella homolactica]QQO09371.1 sugar ABC transporter permease [Breznakiella homolactica]
MGEMKWLGIRNYVFVFRDPVFWQSLGNTLLYALCSPIFKNILGLVLALIFVQKIRGNYFFRVCTYIPYTFSYVVVGVLWIWIYNPTFGLLNSFLRLINAEFLIKGWLSDPNIALFSVIAVDVWKCMGFHAVLFMAGLQAIPQELYEAADIDGASGLRKFISVTIPQLNSTIVLSILLALTGAFVNNFDVVNIMTEGGPFHSTEVVLTHIMGTAFRFSNMGKANAMSVVLVAFVAVFGFIQLKTMTRDENYE